MDELPQAHEIPKKGLTFVRVMTVTILVLVFLIGVFAGYQKYQDLQIEDNVVLSTNYEPIHEYGLPVGHAVAPLERERWTVEVDTDADGVHDFVREITFEQFQALHPGDIFPEPSGTTVTD